MTQEEPVVTYLKDVWDSFKDWVINVEDWFLEMCGLK